MAQLGTHRPLVDTFTTPTSQNMPTFEQVIQGEEAVWPTTGSPVKVVNPEQEDDLKTHSKKSYLTLVKESASKLRYSLSGKKFEPEPEPEPEPKCIDNNQTPPWGVTLDDDEDEDNPEILKTPTYESELALGVYKNPANIQQQETLSVYEKHERKNEAAFGSNKQLKKVGSPKSPTATLESRSYFTISRMAPGARGDGGSTVASPRATDTENNPVKEYFMQNLQSAEDETLSQVISNAISSRKSPDDLSVVEKVKESVTSHLRPEQEFSPPSTYKTINSSHLRPEQEFSPPSTYKTINSSSIIPTYGDSSHSTRNLNLLPTTLTHQINTNSPLYVPVSLSSYDVLDEEKRERILQTN